MEQDDNTRYELKRTVQLELLQDRVIDVRTLSISERDMVCSSDTPLEAATAVSFTLKVPGHKEPFSGKGVVTGYETMIGFLSDSYNIEIDFVEPSEGFLNAIRSYAAEREPLD